MDNPTIIEMTFQTKMAGGRTYYYPVCENSKKLVVLMKRKTLVAGDRERLDDFLSILNAKSDIFILPLQEEDT